MPKSSVSLIMGVKTESHMRIFARPPGWFFFYKEEEEK
jgi:hypothetical protein